jgi:competence protein ComEA
MILSATEAAAPQRWEVENETGTIGAALDTDSRSLGKGMTGPTETSPPQPLASQKVDGLVEEEAPSLGLSGGDRFFLVVSATVILLLLGWRLASRRWVRVAPVEIHRPEENRYALRVEINSATWVEWMQLEGIGETTARAIVTDREQRGPFQDVDDLMRVKGIGRVTLDRMRPWLDCRSAADRTAQPARTGGDSNSNR